MRTSPYTKDLVDWAIEAVHTDPRTRVLVVACTSSQRDMAHSEVAHWIRDNPGATAYRDEIRFYEGGRILFMSALSAESRVRGMIFDQIFLCDDVPERVRVVVAPAEKRAPRR